MRKNIGILDAFVRLTLGFLLFGKGIHTRCNMLLAISSMMIASGITRFCPCYRLLGLSSCCDKHLATPMKFQHQNS